jgi:nucleoid-associated protein YgaU
VERRSHPSGRWRDAATQTGGWETIRADEETTWRESGCRAAAEAAAAETAAAEAAAAEAAATGAAASEDAAAEAAAAEAATAEAVAAEAATAEAVAAEAATAEAVAAEVTALEVPSFTAFTQVGTEKEQRKNREEWERCNEIMVTEKESIYQGTAINTSVIPQGQKGKCDGKGRKEDRRWEKLPDGGGNQNLVRAKVQCKKLWVRHQHLAAQVRG